MTDVTISGAKWMTRGQISKRTGCNAETIRYYERIGVIPPPKRSSAGHRRYSDNDADRVAFVLRSRELGFRLDQVRNLLSLADRGNDSCADVRAMTSAHVASIRSKINDLRRMERVLKDLVAKCEEGTVPACPIIESLYLGDDRLPPI
ncbi:MAG: helix-turn-helix domain-containing protein [Alphaproteobacteria bacterium]